MKIQKLFIGLTIGWIIAEGLTINNPDVWVAGLLLAGLFLWLLLTNTKR